MQKLPTSVVLLLALAAVAVVAVSAVLIKRGMPDRQVAPSERQVDIASPVGTARDVPPPAGVRDTTAEKPATIRTMDSNDLPLPPAPGEHMPIRGTALPRGVSINTIPANPNPAPVSAAEARRRVGAVLPLVAKARDIAEKIDLTEEQRGQIAAVDEKYDANFLKDIQPSVTQMQQELAQLQKLLDEANQTNSPSRRLLEDQVYSAQQDLNATLLRARNDYLNRMQKVLSESQFNQLRVQTLSDLTPRTAPAPETP